MKNKICIECGEENPLSNFYQIKSKYYHSRCKPCSIKESAEWAKKNQDRRYAHHKKWRNKYHNQPNIKTQQILDGMRSRSKRKSFSPPEFTRKEIEKIIVNGRCVITDIPFEFNQDTFSRSPWTPTPDRINSLLGYTKENTQWVCYMYNVMKDEFTNKEVLILLDALNANREKIVEDNF